MGKPKRIADTVADFLDEDDQLPRLACLTDGEWAERDAAVAAAVADQRSRAQARVKAGVPSELVERGLSMRHVRRLLAGPLDASPALESCTRAEVGIWVLAGNVGCGKTTAAHWWLVGDIVSRTSAELRGVRMVTAAAFARESRYGDKHETLGGVPRFAIDDLGAEYLDEKTGSVEAASRRLDIPARTLRAALAGGNLRRGTRLLIERQLDALA